MPVEIKITGEHADQALAELRSLAHAVATAPPPPAPPPTSEPLTGDEAVKFPDDTPKRRGRPPKTAQIDATAEAAVEMQSQPTEAPEPELEAPKAEQEFSEDDVRKALSDLLAQPNGKEAARTIFAEFGVAKISEIAADKRKAFIAAIAAKRGVA